MEKQNLQKDSSGIQTVGSVLKVIGSWIYRLRKVLMAIPVIFAAIYLARYNMANLPAQAGSDGRLSVADVLLPADLLPLDHQYFHPGVAYFAVSDQCLPQLRSKKNEIEDLL